MQGSDAQLMEESMSHAIRQPRILLALFGTVAALCLGLLGPKSAQAEWKNFCNPKTLSGYGECVGTGQYLNQVYGWGDQHSVCVEAYPASSSRRCSSGPGAGVYTPVQGNSPGIPRILNNAAGTNTVHGVVLW
jgi:hypothetical protein